MRESLAARVRHRAVRIAGAVALCAIVPAGVVAVSVWPSEAAVAPAAGGMYTIASGASGKCLDVASAGTANGGLLVQVACNAAATDQQFTATSQNGAFGLVNGNSGKCVDIPYSATTTGTQLWQWTCGASANQTWSFTASAAASGKFLIKSALNGLCVSNKDGSTAGNNPIVQETCSDISRMQWSFTYVSGSTSPTTSPTSGTKPTVAADGTGTYKTVQAAINAVPANNTTPRTITIKAGTYREIVTIPKDKPYITLQGLGSGPANTVIVYNKWAGGGFDRGSATMFVDAPNSNLTNLTVSNDFDETTQTSGQQAVALQIDSDRSILRNVRLLADQDTFQINNNSRTYVVNSYIEGTVDFIYSGGIAVFNACQIYQKRSTGGTITAASTPAERTYGFLFYKSTITGAGSNSTNLGRPWRQGAQVVYRESSLSNIIKLAQPWVDMSTNTWQNARFFEYKNTGAGATVNSNRPQLTAAQAANYTPQKYLAGADGWNPL
jgi:pectin methylesterase-like acyl-CoA thioesterase